MIGLLRVTAFGAKIKKFILTYTSGVGGSISGLTSQIVKKQASGTQVVAIPNEGYYFDKWSDNVITAERMDTNIQSNINVNATFGLITPPIPQGATNIIDWSYT